MNKKSILLAIVVVIAIAFISLNGKRTQVSASIDNLLPKPQQLEQTGGSAFSFKRPIRIDMTGKFDEKGPAVAEELQEMVAASGGIVSDKAKAAISAKLVDAVSGAEFQEEAYALTVGKNSIEIEAVSPAGAYWAVQTLWQLIEDDGVAESVRIIDWPAWRIRGYMHDVGRDFIEPEELKAEITKLSRYKINVFHWHLTDNQGWRLESRIYPQLNGDAAFSRLPGKYYTIEQAQELVRHARRHGMTVIPELDMPGHSQAFRQAMGHSMLTEEGLAEVKALVNEACGTFEGVEYMHIGTDELRAEDRGTMDWRDFIPEIADLIHARGKKILSWRPGYDYEPGQLDMAQLWGRAGEAQGDGVPVLDSRYHYANHYDNFADIVALYKSRIYYMEKQSESVEGTIVAFWNDRRLPAGEDIIRQNQFYACLVAMAERAWTGGGNGYFEDTGVSLDSSDTDFFDWERRFLLQKEGWLSDMEVPYVRQSNVLWKITEAFPNGGDATAVFPPETEPTAGTYSYNGVEYGTSYALGAGKYLRHTWGSLVPAFFSDPKVNSTAYAYTYVYSKTRQDAGLWVEFQNYSRSDSDLPPPQGCWDYKGSKIWMNDIEIEPPVWENSHSVRDTEITLKNENMTARPPIAVTLMPGWNKILLKLPYVEVDKAAIRLNKWMFACVLTDPSGREALPDIIYSPDRRLQE